VVQVSDTSGTGWLEYKGTGKPRWAKQAGERCASAPTSPLAWNQPGGVAYGSDGKIYVTDTRNHRLVRMDDFTGTNLVSFGLDGSGPNQFVRPYGLFVR
jgi:DNA-binding beta-propeller fold protein YncE